MRRVAAPRKRPAIQRTAVRTASASFPSLCRAVGIPSPVPEFKFHPTRKWRIDWCWPEQKLALEIDGGVFIQGRHTRASGWLKDSEKLNTAAVMGYRLLRCTPQQLASGAILKTVEEALLWI